MKGTGVGKDLSMVKPEKPRLLAHATEYTVDAFMDLGDPKRAYVTLGHVEFPGAFEGTQ